jgi:putative RNA 2'-phosphotransferase
MSTRSRNKKTDGRLYMSDQLVKISKLLSFILRHDPASHGIKLDEHGYANVEELIKKIDISMDELMEVVATNDKQRFSFNEDETLIRANQGHSIAVNLQLEPVEPPEILYHGTAARFLNSILSRGLVKGSRQYVHLSSDERTAQKVGERHGRAIVLKIQSGWMHKRELKFFLSKNNVWLTDYVPVDFIKV